MENEMLNELSEIHEILMEQAEVVCQSGCGWYGDSDELIMVDEEVQSPKDGGYEPTGHQIEACPVCEDNNLKYFSDATGFVDEESIPEVVGLVAKLTANLNKRDGRANWHFDFPGHVPWFSVRRFEDAPDFTNRFKVQFRTDDVLVCSFRDKVTGIGTVFAGIMEGEDNE
jgi:hypothetical protein